MPAKRRTEFQFDLTGGHPALDLANTLSRRHDPERRKEHLEDYADLLSFAVQDKIVSPHRASRLRQQAERNMLEALRAFRKAILLREAIYRVFAAIAQGKGPLPEDLQMLSDYAVEALRHRRLVPAKGRSYRWEWQEEGKNQLEHILWPVAKAAADLLTAAELETLRWCEAPDCEWLFLDNSRNRSRRWCDMASCGNRAKARRHYQRARE
jgi:predicted RNA-binding Zn ribbon-like protein